MELGFSPSGRLCQVSRCDSDLYLSQPPTCTYDNFAILQLSISMLDIFVLLTRVYVDFHVCLLRKIKQEIIMQKTKATCIVPIYFLQLHSGGIFWWSTFLQPSYKHIDQHLTWISIPSLFFEAITRWSSIFIFYPFTCEWFVSRDNSHIHTWKRRGGQLLASRGGRLNITSSTRHGKGLILYLMLWEGDTAFCHSLEMEQLEE